jgi:hypothetical protein
MTTSTWTLPAPWAIPREWPGERCFILCGGESVNQVRDLIPRLRGRWIVVKEGVLLKPDADVLFIAGEGSDTIARPLIPKFRGTHILVRGKSSPFLANVSKRVTRTKDHTRLCELPTHVCGYDSGTSAINAAYHFGATEIVLIGYDMVGHRWFNGEWTHPMPRIPVDHHQTHLGPLKALAADCRARGLRVVNTSPISRERWFERGRLEDFL